MRKHVDHDFSTYRLETCRVEKMGNELLPEMADFFEVPHTGSADAHAAELAQLQDVLGTSTDLERDVPQVLGFMVDKLGSEEAAIARAADWVERSGIHKPVNRSLWKSSLPAPDTAPIYVVGGTANWVNWMDRTADLLIAQDNRDRRVHVHTGDRDMSTFTERAHPNVVDYIASPPGGTHAPNESEYVDVFITPRLMQAGYKVAHVEHETTSGVEIARAMAKRSLIESEGPVVFAQSARTGVIHTAAQVRRAVRTINAAATGLPLNPEFDSKEDPLAFILTDGFSIAHTAEHTRNPADYQNPIHVLRHIASTARALVEIQQENPQDDTRG